MSMYSYSCCPFWLSCTRKAGFLCSGGEGHVSDGGVGEQLLGVTPHQLLARLGCEVVQFLEVFQPAFGCDEGIVGAKEETILHARGGAAQEYFRDALWYPAGQVVVDVGFVLHGGQHFFVPGPGGMR